MRGQLFARWALVLGVGRQQQARLEEGQPGRHDEVIGGEFDPQAARLLDEGQVLLGQMKDRDPAADRPSGCATASAAGRAGPRSRPRRRSAPRRRGVPRCRSGRPVQTSAPARISCNSASSAGSSAGCGALRAASAASARDRRHGPRSPEASPRAASRPDCRCSAGSRRNPQRARARQRSPIGPPSAPIEMSSVIRRPPKPMRLRIVVDDRRRQCRREIRVERRIDDMGRHRHRQVARAPRTVRNPAPPVRDRGDDGQIQMAVRPRGAVARACA